LRSILRPDLLDKEIIEVANIMREYLIEILVTTMHQTDFSKYQEMNLQTDAVIANQSNQTKFEQIELNDNTVKMITTETRGVSKNRNIAFMYAQSDIILFSDDDMIFVNNYKKIINDAFNLYKDADAIKFYVESLNPERMTKNISKNKKANRRDVTSIGVCGLAIKLKSLQKKNIFFSHFFGPGTDIYCGEDSIFLQDMINKGLNVYLCEDKIASVAQEESCWFEGFSDRYFVTKGMIFAAIYPKLCYLIAIRTAYKFTKRKTDKDKSFWQICKNIYKGIMEYKKT